MPTMIGDGHTAFPRNSACFDSAVLRQIVTLTLPPEGTGCQQATPFAPVAPPAAAAPAVPAASAGAQARDLAESIR